MPHLSKSGDEVTQYWESKYKVCRAAFVAMGRIQRDYKREHIKLMQRLQQMSWDGQQMGSPDVAKDNQFERIRQTILEHIREEVA